jgi:hypothetical protein
MNGALHVVVVSRGAYIASSRGDDTRGAHSDASDLAGFEERHERFRC